MGRDRHAAWSRWSPHLWWLKQVDFAPLTYAGDVYALTDRAECLQLVLGYIGHNLALLAVAGSAGCAGAGMASSADAGRA